jgi:uncharacterized protein YprB with RNaseH-like and TPR domain
MKRKRLNTLDRFMELPGDSAPVEENLAKLAEIIEAEIVTGPSGRILKIIDDIDLFPYSEIKDIHDHLHDDLYRRWHFVTGGDDSGYDPRRFIFFDTETTGLSGGAGMVIFLCGFGFFLDDRFRVVQYFLPDYPDEPLFLHRSLEHLRPDSILVTYNGKAFDWPMLTQRLTINRIDIPDLSDHIDVLHPARSLFRRLGEDCSLISMEKHLLSFDRGEDIPGYLIPSKYFDYLYDRQPGMIPEIIRHNRLDVISLALVTRYIPEIIRRPERINSSPLLEGIVNHFFRNRRFESLADYMDQVRPGHFEESSAVAMLQYSLALKSLGRLDKASDIWKLASENRTGPHVVKHLLELAKYQEHREKDPETALETVDLLLSLEMTPAQKAQVLHRRKRLLNKVERLSSKSL